MSSLLIACGSPTSPSSSSTLDRFVQALRNQGLTVILAGQMSPSANGFFSVPTDEVRVNDSRVNVFVYPSAEAAATEAALISKDGQPSPTARVTWVSTPHFYRQDSMIVLYVGCATEIVDALQKTVGAPTAVGPNPARLAGKVREPYVHALGLRARNRLYDRLFRLTVPCPESAPASERPEDALLHQHVHDALTRDRVATPPSLVHRQ